MASMLLGSTLLLTGCWGLASMEQTGLVTLLGMDALPGGQYQVTVGVVNPFGLPTPTGSSPGGQPELVRSAVGPSPAAALLRLSASSYLDLDFSHLQGVIVSTALARAGLATPLGFLARSAPFVQTPLLLIARGESAAAVVHESQAMLPDGGQVLTGTSAWARDLFPVHPVRLFRFLDQTQITGDQPTAPGLRVPSAQGQSTSTAFSLDGTALFRGDRLVGWLGQAATLGWLLATDRVRAQTVLVPTAAGGVYTVQLNATHCQVQVWQGAHGPEAHLRIRVRASLLAIQAAPADFWGHPAEVTAVEAATARQLAADVRQGLRAARAAGSDVFGLGEYVRIHDPQAWYRMDGDWNTVGFPQLPVTLQVGVTLRALGKRFCPLRGLC